MAPGLFGFGMSLALERDNGLLTLKRAMPSRRRRICSAKMVMAMLMAALIAGLLLAIAFANVQLHPVQMLQLAGVCIFGALPFCALGLLLGTLVKGHGAPAVVNLLYLPMAFMSGLWFRRRCCRRWCATSRRCGPASTLNALAQTALGFDVGSAWPHAVWLVVFSVAVFAIAAWRLRRHG